jgi:hypothetical protein
MAAAWRAGGRTGPFYGICSLRAEEAQAPAIGPEVPAGGVGGQARAPATAYRKGARGDAGEELLHGADGGDRLRRPVSAAPSPGHVSFAGPFLPRLVDG